MEKQFWLVKQEPEDFSWTDLVRDKRTQWTGVRNYQARNHLRAMKRGDRVAFYHSVSEKRVVGIARIVREHYPDPTAKDGDWSAVDLAPVRALRKPVSLDNIKSDAVLKSMPLVRQSRLSVSPLKEQQFARLLELGGLQQPRPRRS